MPEAGTIGATLLGFLVWGSRYTSLGCLASAITRRQIIAAMLRMGGGISRFLMSYISMGFTTQTGWKAQFGAQLSLIEHMRDFARGVVDTRPVIFYLSFTILFLFLTLKVVESRRWK